MAEQNTIPGLARASHNGRIKAGEKAAAPQTMQYTEELHNSNGPIFNAVYPSITLALP
jgi:hypothetical protein